MIWQLYGGQYDSVRVLDANRLGRTPGDAMQIIQAILKGEKTKETNFWRNNERRLARFGLAAYDELQRRGYKKKLKLYGVLSDVAYTTRSHHLARSDRWWQTCTLYYMSRQAELYRRDPYFYHFLKGDIVGYENAPVWWPEEES